MTWPSGTATQLKNLFTLSFWPQEWPTSREKGYENLINEMITNKIGKCFDFSSNSLNYILKKLYEDQSGFVDVGDGLAQLVGYRVQRKSCPIAWG